MLLRTLVLSSGRNLVLGPLKLPIDYSFSQSFVALVPAFDVGERQLVEAMTGPLVDLGCIEFCCVGHQAEQLHDSLDEIIEARGVLEVATTWHADYSDACEYFLFAAGGRPPTLLALVSGHADLAAFLEREARSV